MPTAWIFVHQALCYDLEVTASRGDRHVDVAARLGGTGVDSSPHLRAELGKPALQVLD